jgi:hypothetical protein
MTRSTAVCGWAQNLNPITVNTTVMMKKSNIDAANTLMVRT